MDYNVTDNNVHINRSCEIPKRDFQSSLLHIRGLYPDCKVFINRTLLSLKLEWACHNFYISSTSQESVLRALTSTGLCVGGWNSCTTWEAFSYGYSLNKFKQQ